MATTSLKKLSDDSPVQIEESNILVVYGTTSDAKVEYVNPNSGRKELVEVANSVTQIAEVSEKLFEIGLSNISDTVYLNSDRVVSLYEDNSLAVIIYDRAGAEKARFATTDSKEVVLDRIYVKEGYLTYDAASYTANTIVLDAAEGDVSANFTAGKILTLFGSTDANNETYEVASASHSGSTTITVTGAITDTADTEGKVMIKS